MLYPLSAHNCRMLAPALYRASSVAPARARSAPESRALLVRTGNTASPPTHTSLARSHPLCHPRPSETTGRGQPGGPGDLLNLLAA